VDKKYMAGLGSDAINPFLKEVLSVCKERGLMVCMGGVEAEWQMEQLRLLSVDCMQGFLFSSPLPLAAYEEKLVAFMTNRHGDTVGSKAAPTGEESL
ncbi:MAG: EAL domain-containing protein, partial [Clostridia bacterium]